MDEANIRARFEAGEQREALKLFEKEVLAAKKRKDLESLHRAQPLAQSFVDKSTGRDRKFAERILYIITQNIRLLEASQTSAARVDQDHAAERSDAESPLMNEHEDLETKEIRTAGSSPSELTPPLDAEHVTSGDFANLNRKVKTALIDNLLPNETIRVIIRGARSQAMIGTDRRVFVCKPGFAAGAAFGVEVTSWSYVNLLGVQRHKGMVSGAIVLQGPGQSGKKTSYWGNKDDDPFKAPNALPIAGNWKHVDVGVTRLRHLIDAAHTPIATPQATTPTPASTADELRKLAELHAEGILTAEEFQAAKAQLLTR
jgi:Short C-terminal domain